MLQYVEGCSSRHTRYIRFEVFTAVTMKNGVFCDVTLCGSCKNQVLARTRFLQEPHSVTFQKTPFFILDIHDGKNACCCVDNSGGLVTILEQEGKRRMVGFRFRNGQF
jgi:hypothetical protein